MEQCFHKSCDVASSLPDLQASLSFLSSITQALVWATYELTTNSTKPQVDCALNVPDLPTKVEEAQVNEIPQEPKVDYDQLKEWTLKNYQPNTGTQINIENLYVNNMNLKGGSIEDQLEKTDKKKDLLLLMEKSDPLAQIVNNYFDKKEQNRKLKNKKNSPMWIKMMKEL